MSTQPDTPGRSPAAKHAQAVDKVCDAFEAAVLAGQQPRMEDYLKQTDQRLCGQLLEELLLAELDLQIGNGVAPDRDQYIARFPACVDLIDRTIGQAKNASTASRHRHTTSHSAAASDAGALCIRCPHCHNPIEIVVDAPLDDIKCSSCGSHFNLVQDEMTTLAASTITTVGHFELIERLGIGGFGTVWKARDTELDRTVAVKISRQGRLGSGEVDSFLREARASAQLNHPNIVSVHEVGRDEDTVYIVSDLVRGVALADWLTAKRPPFREAAQLCAKIALALDHAHEAGVIHRDIKPQNIMLDAESEPHLMDFGLARRDAGEVTMTVDGRVLGTPAYMSPEQARGEAHRADRRTDVYSLGVILFELLTGELPFRGSLRMLLHQVLHEDAPSPRRLKRSVPRDLETICLKCLEKDPRKRFSTAEELAGELRRFLAGQPIHARPITRAARTWRWCTRNPMGAAVVGLLIFLAVVAPVVAMHQASLRLDIADQQKETMRKLYVSQINVADSAWNNNNVGRVRELLERQMPEHTGGIDYRGWEWRYLSRVSNSELRTLEFTALSLAFTPDGQHLVSGGQDGTLKMWNADGTHEVRSIIKAHDDRVHSIALDRDGMYLVTGSSDKTVKLWETATCRVVRTFPSGDSRRYGIALSPEGTHLAIGDSGIITCWDVADEKQIWAVKGDEGGIGALAFSPDGSRLVSGSSDGAVKLWDVTAGRELRTLAGHGTGVRAVAFSPDGRMLASGSFDGMLKSWDVGTGLESVPFKGHLQNITKLVFSPDGKRLASSSDDSTVKIWDAATGRETQTLRGHATTVTDVAFSPSGNVIASGSWDGTIRLWDAASRQEPWSLPHPGWRARVVFSPDGKYLAAGGRGEPGAITVFDASTGIPLWAEREKHSSFIRLRFDPQSRVLATGLEDGSVRLRDAEDGHVLQTFQGHTGAVLSLDFSPDGRILATGGGRDDRWVVLWNPVDGQRLAVLEGHTEDVLDVVFSPDGKLLASTGGEGDNQVRLWDTSTGRLLRKFVGHEGAVGCAVFSHDGQQLFTGSWDEMIRAWDVGTGDAIEVKRGHAGTVFGLSLNHNGTRLASCSNDRTIKIWDPVTLQELQTLKPKAIVNSVAFSPDGTRLAAGLFNRPVAVWDARPLTAELRADLAAADLVRSLFARDLAPKEVIETLKADATISEPVRQRALELARQRRGEPFSTQ